MHIPVFDEELRLTKVALLSQSNYNALMAGKKIFFGEEYQVITQMDDTPSLNQYIRENLSVTKKMWRGIYCRETDLLVGVIETKTD